MDHGNSAHSLEPRLSYRAPLSSELSPQDAKCGSTSTTVNVWPCTQMVSRNDVGTRKVRGGKHTSASPGKAEHHARSAPRSMKLVVLSLSSSGRSDAYVPHDRPRSAGRCLPESERRQRVRQQRVAHRVPHGNVQAARRRHRRLLRAASGHELARDVQVAHAAPQVDGAIRIVGPRGDGAQPLEAFVDEGDGHGERVRARARLVAQRVVDRAVGCGGVEAQRQHVRRGEVGLARLWPVDEVGEGEARLAALVEDSVRPAAPVAARSASQDVLEALEIVGRARRFELGDDGVYAARESGVQLLVADPQEAVHACGGQY